jgi:hypothetical protein
LDLSPLNILRHCHKHGLRTTKEWYRQRLAFMIQRDAGAYARASKRIRERWLRRLRMAEWMTEIASEQVWGLMNAHLIFSSHSCRQTEKDWKWGIVIKLMSTTVCRGDPTHIKYIRRGGAHMKYLPPEFFSLRPKFRWHLINLHSVTSLADTAPHKSVDTGWNLILTLINHWRTDQRACWRCRSTF